jgi:hypothetical protein
MDQYGRENEKLHHGKSITKIEISPKGKYLVTYSKENHSIVWWIDKDLYKGREDVDNKRRFKLDSDTIIIEDAKPDKNTTNNVKNTSNKDIQINVQEFTIEYSGGKRHIEKLDIVDKEVNSKHDYEENKSTSNKCVFPMIKNLLIFMLIMAILI